MVTQVCTRDFYPFLIFTLKLLGGTSSGVNMDRIQSRHRGNTPRPDTKPETRRTPTEWQSLLLRLGPVRPGRSENP